MLTQTKLWAFGGGVVGGLVATCLLLWSPFGPRSPSASSESSVVEVFRQAAPSVVSVKAIAVERSYLSMNLNAIERGAGSGFIWNDEGHIVTNLHVIVDADAIQVTTQDQKTYRATLVGAAPSMDLAVLKVDPSAVRGRAKLALGQSSSLEVGQQVLAIGNPFGLDQSLTTGVVSALGRSIESLVGTEIVDVIQTDAAINPGNSGGPLLDSRGQLIGINTAIRSPSGGSAGVGFAVPVKTIKRAIPDLIRFGRIRRPTMGLRLAPAHIAQRLNLQGLLVWTVARGGPAEEAGIRPTRYDRSGRLSLGDQIVMVDGNRVRGEEELIVALEKLRPGDHLSVAVLRGDAVSEVRVRLAAFQ